MTSLNEEEKQLFETLLNQADAVAPATDKTQHSARDSNLGKVQLINYKLIYSFPLTPVSVFLSIFFFLLLLLIISLYIHPVFMFIILYNYA